VFGKKFMKLIFKRYRFVTETAARLATGWFFEQKTGPNRRVCRKALKVFPRNKGSAGVILKNIYLFQNIPLTI
jgi:hypothetical protein